MALYKLCLHSLFTGADMTLCSLLGECIQTLTKSTTPQKLAREYSQGTQSLVQAYKANRKTPYLPQRMIVNNWSSHVVL